MKNLKSWKIFLEELITDTNRLLEPRIEQYLNTISLYHCGEHIWAIQIKDSHSRAMVFLRSQEYYESAFEEIIRHQFKVSKYMDMYKQHYGKQEFTYGSDWSGFNIPSDILEECMFNIEQDEINNYDKIMLSIIHKIKETEGDDKYYLLGVDELNNDLLEHEFAHAMYFVLPEYKSDMTKLNKDCDRIVKESMYKCITEYGYADHVLPDELQAYLSTGLGRKMKEAKIPGIEMEMKKHREIFDRYYKNCLYSEPKKTKVNWEL
jgi:hypothetical protein